MVPTYVSSTLPYPKYLQGGGEEESTSREGVSQSAERGRAPATAGGGWVLT